MKEKIELQKERDFSENISTLFQIIRTQFKKLFGAIIFIAGPIILIASIAIAYLTIQNLNSVIGTSPTDPGYLSGILGTYSKALIGYIGLWFGYSMVGVVTFSYLKIYKNSANYEEITTDDIWNESKKHILKVIVASILTGIMIVLGMIFLFIPGIILAIFLSMVIPTIIFEQESIGEAINKSFRYISDNFWITLGLAIVVTLITYLISFAFSIPSVILNFIWSLNNIQSIESGGGIESFSDTFTLFYMLAALLSNLASMIISTIPNVSIAIHYFNLKEQKDSTGLMGQISQMGGIAQEEEETY